MSEDTNLDPSLQTDQQGDELREQLRGQTCELVLNERDRRIILEITDSMRGFIWAKLKRQDWDYFRESLYPKLSNLTKV